MIRNPKGEKMRLREVAEMVDSPSRLKILASIKDY
jgi:hypothetical protein